MNAKLIIDAVVRHSMALVAQVATSSGIRAPLAHIGEQTFLVLANELEERGVSRKVAADMFAMTYRAYQLKIQRMGEREGDELDVTLWEEIFEYLRERESASKADVLSHFHHEAPAKIGSILYDMVQSELLRSEGRGETARFWTATQTDVDQILARSTPDSFAHIVWLTIFHRGPIRHGRLAGEFPGRERQLSDALDHLLEAGQIVEGEEDGETTYSSAEVYIPTGRVAGWEAALVDHFRAVVTAICTKLGEGELSNDDRDLVGGATFHFDLWDDHPMRDASQYRGRSPEGPKLSLKGRSP
ncbi:MAG: hypothetical protein R3324_04775 [Halobacteriales archaeon]|nr:hypothetical protein [Halobacteriales archaeon]